MTPAHEVALPISTKLLFKDPTSKFSQFLNGWNSEPHPAKFRSRRTHESAQSVERSIPITTHPDAKDGFQHFRHGCTPPLTGLSIAEMDKEDGFSIAGIPNTFTILNVN